MIPGDEPHTYDTLKGNTPAEKHAARITIAEHALAGGWTDEVPTLAAMLGVDR